MTSESITEIFRGMQIVLDETPYILIKMPPNAITVSAGVIAETGIPFTTMIVDKNEVSLILPEIAYEDFASRLRGHVVAEKRYNLITFDGELELSLVGFMAMVSKALADTGVSIMPIAAYTTDHILVPEDQATIAMQALNELKNQ